MSSEGFITGISTQMTEAPAPQANVRLECCETLLSLLARSCSYCKSRLQLWVQIRNRSMGGGWATPGIGTPALAARDRHRKFCAAPAGRERAHTISTSPQSSSHATRILPPTMQWSTIYIRPHKSHADRCMHNARSSVSKGQGKKVQGGQESSDPCACEAGWQGETQHTCGPHG